MFGLGMCLVVTMVSMISLILIGAVFRRLLYRREKQRNLATIIVLGYVLVVKLVYYFGWVGDSFAVYFNDLKDDEVSLTIYRSALAVFVPFHFLDIVRQVAMIVLLVTMHLKFKREAREARLRIEAGQPA